MSDASRPEGLHRSERLRRRPDYQRCYRQGRRRHGPLATLHVHRNELEHPRLGITASRKVGKSVVRQRTKRRVREIFRRSPTRVDLGAVDVVVHLKPAAAHASFEQLRDELERLFRSTVLRDRDRGLRRAQ